MFILFCVKNHSVKKKNTWFLLDNLTHSLLEDFWKHILLRRMVDWLINKILKWLSIPQNKFVVKNVTLTTWRRFEKAWSYKMDLGKNSIMVSSYYVRSQQSKSVGISNAQFELCFCWANLWSDNKLSGIDLRLVSYVFWLHRSPSWIGKLIRTFHARGKYLS